VDSIVGDVFFVCCEERHGLSLPGGAVLFIYSVQQCIHLHANWTVHL